MMKAVLLINLGTPQSASPHEVKKYLGQFLMDPYVVDIPWVLRALLVYGIILRTRPKKSAELYKKIWTERGSPLLAHSIDLTNAVAKKLGSNYRVELGMRYGNPSIGESLKKLVSKDLKELTVIPLYPQYSLATTQSSLDCVKSELARIGQKDLIVKILRDFYQDPLFISAFAEAISEEIKGKDWDHMIMSYHGLPERQILKTGSNERPCFKSDSCCHEIRDNNQACYRAQCFETTRQLVKKLNLPQEKVSTSFQSRLGRTPWIQPYTDTVIGELAQRGAKKLVIASPSFVGDCLETLEELAIRGQEQFIEAGGREYYFVPSLNSRSSWVEAVVKFCEKQDLAII